MQYESRMIYVLKYEASKERFEIGDFPTPVSSTRWSSDPVGHWFVLKLTILLSYINLFYKALVL